MTSAQTAPRFLDGYHKFKDAMYEPQLEVVIDVRALLRDKKAKGKEPDVALQHESVGWAVLPVFSADDRYVASGMYQLPIIEGPFPKALLEEDDSINTIVQREVAETRGNK